MISYFNTQYNMSCVNYIYTGFSKHKCYFDGMLIGLYANNWIINSTINLLNKYNFLYHNINFDIVFIFMIKLFV